MLSPNRDFKIIYQTDGNLVLYKGTGEWIWDIQKPNTGGRFDVQDDSNVVVYTADSCKALWARAK